MWAWRISWIKRSRCVAIKKNLKETCCSPPCARFSTFREIKCEYYLKVKIILRVTSRMNFLYLAKVLYLVNLLWFSWILSVLFVKKEGVCCRDGKIVWFFTLFNAYMAFWRNSNYKKTNLPFTCSKSTIRTLEQDVKPI